MPICRRCSLRSKISTPLPPRIILSSADALALADLNQDGVVNAADVQMLMNMLTQTSTSPQNVPEPAGWLLMGIAGVALAINRAANRRRRI